MTHLNNHIRQSRATHQKHACIHSSQHAPLALSVHAQAQTSYDGCNQVHAQGSLIADILSQEALLVSNINQSTAPQRIGPPAKPLHLLKPACSVPMIRRISHAAAAIKVCATHAPSSLISLAWTRVHFTWVAALHMHCNSIKRPEQTSVCCVAFLTLLPIHLSHPLRPCY